MTLRARGLPIFSPRNILNHLRSNDLGIVSELEADELEGSLSMSSIFFLAFAYIVQLKADLRFDERYSSKGNYNLQ